MASLWEWVQSQARANALGLPTAPDITDETVILAQLEKKRRMAALRGRAATFLTGPRGVGVGLPSGELAQAFMRAAAEGQPFGPPQVLIGAGPAPTYTPPATQPRPAPRRPGVPRTYLP